MSEKYLKSPMNYTGGKHKILNQILPIFPQNIDIFLDLFAGGLDVSLNVNALEIYCNDINYYVIKIYKEFQRLGEEEVLRYINKRISKFKLTKENKEGFIEFRAYYNKLKHKNPLDLYVLLCYSFNYQIRFNNSHEYNSPFGANRSWFNPVMMNNLITMCKKIKDFNFLMSDFEDVKVMDKLTARSVVYADPPYLITTGSYNDGKRGFNGWGVDDDRRLMCFMNSLNDNNIKFALSNVIEHKGIVNQPLLDWANKYNVHEISKNYNNCNYQAMNKNNNTREVLITNF